MTQPEATTTPSLGMGMLSTVGVTVYSFAVAVVLTPFRSAFGVAFYDTHAESE